MRKTKKLLAALSVTFAMVMGVFGTGAAISSYAAETSAEEEFTISSTELAKKLGHGINLGNTMECTTQWVKEPTMKDYETGWGAPYTTKAMITGMKEAGFDSIRIPISWLNGMYFSDISSNYSSKLDYMKLFKDDKDAKVKDEFFDRIDELIGYAFDNDMYVIINDHYDYGWWDAFKDKDTYDAAMYHYESMWNQIADHYKDYPEKLIFESANEELSAAYESWENEKDFMGYDTVNAINQKFVDVVRKSGGNNDKRYLLIAGVNTNIDKTCDDRFKMPTDTIENHMLVSVHFYDPYTYCDMWKDASWGKAKFDWGTTSEKDNMTKTLDKMKKFTDTGYGVIIGEYGVLPRLNGSKYERKNNDVEYFKYFLDICDNNGYAPFLWDQCGMYDREKASMRFDDVAAVFYKTDKLAVSDTLGVPALPTLTNTDDGVSIKWKAVSGATGYILLRRLGEKGAYEELAYVAGGKTVSYVDKDVTVGKAYYYTVQTVKDGAKSKYNTNGKQIFRFENQEIKNLENVKAGITVTWNKATGAKGYYIYRQAGSGKEKLIKKINSAKTAKFTDKTAKNGITYTYKVAAINGSSESTATGMKILRLNTPAIKAVTSKKPALLTVKWGKNTKATGYQIKYVLGKTTKTVSVSKAKSVIKEISPLTKGKTYKVYVRSYKTVKGNTYYSSWSTAKKCKIKK